LPIRGKWSVVRYGLDKFVILGEDGTLVTSTDGINWTALDRKLVLPTDIWIDLHWNGVFWTAVQNLSPGLYSTATTSDYNLLSWTYATSDCCYLTANKNWTSIASGNGYVIVTQYRVQEPSTNKLIAYSVNGREYQTFTVSNDAWYDIAFLNGRFVSASTSSPRIITFTNPLGAKQYIDLLPSVGPILALNASATKFIGLSATSTIISYTGINWITIPNNVPPGFNAVEIGVGEICTFPTSTTSGPTTSTTSTTTTTTTSTSTTSSTTPIPTPAALGTYFVAGSTSSLSGFSGTRVIEKLSFLYETTSLISSQLSYDVTGASGVTDGSTVGFVAGGIGSASSQNALITISKIVFSNDVVSTSRAFLVSPRNLPASASTEYGYGYFAGGFQNGNALNTVEKIHYAIEISSLVNSAVLSVARGNFKSISDEVERCFFAGGSFNSSYYSNVEKLVFSTEVIVYCFSVETFQSRTWRPFNKWR